MVRAVAPRVLRVDALELHPQLVGLASRIPYPRLSCSVYLRCGLIGAQVVGEQRSSARGERRAARWTARVSGIPSEVIEPPTNSVATLSGPRPSTPTSPAKNVWMSPVRKLTSLDAGRDAM